MKITEAKALKAGDRVMCPPDRGAPGFSGTVERVTQTLNLSHHGQAYIWVEVLGPGRMGAAVWASDQLERT